MSLDYLTLNIIYNIKKNEFTFKGDVKKEAQSTLISEFLRSQIGAGEDNEKANVKDIYHITLKWFPENDKFEVIYDAGNKGLRDGILHYALQKF
jgi:hypothetical protein